MIDHVASDRLSVDPGRLNSRVIIEAPVEASDGQGGVTRNYATQETVWALLLPQAARAGVHADAAGADMRMRAIIRAHAVLTLDHRLNVSGLIYRILTLTPRSDGRFIVIDAAQWQR